jgi:peptidoglycan biosynthesis protein MviN/MurJ (putative lipid II flippase)
MSIPAIFAAVWVTTSLVAYLLTRRAFRIREWSWDHSDALLMALACALMAPMAFVVAAGFNFRYSALSDWLDKPSRW